MLACAGGCEEERKEGGREEKVEGGGFLVLDPRRSRRVCGDQKKDEQRKGKSTQAEVMEAGEAALLEQALLTPLSHTHRHHHDHNQHRHHHSWLLAVRVKETHYMPVLGGETQVSGCCGLGG